MPYKTNNDLPDPIKEALPSAAQDIWRNAFNSAAEKAPGDDAKAAKIAWGAIANAGWVKEGDAWTKKTSQTHEFDAEIFSTGVWNGDKYTDADLEDMVMNFQALGSAIKPPVKLGHKGTGDGQPALGWVKGLRKAGNKLIATLTEVPDVIHKAIQAGLYKRVSSEVFWNLKHGGEVFKRVLAGVALLGADIPAVTNLEDLQRFLSQSIPGGSFDLLRSYERQITTELKLEEDKMDEKLMERITNLEASIAKLDAAKKAAEEEAKTYKTEAEKHKTALDQEHKVRADEVKKTRLEGLKVYIEEAVKKGIITPAGRDILIAVDKHVYTADAGFAITEETFKKFIDTMGAVKKFGEKGEHIKVADLTPATAGVEIDRLTKEYMAKMPTTNYANAMSIVLTMNKELAEVWAKS